MDRIDEKMTEPLQSYYHYWGKAEKEGVRYHLVPYHCLDVAAVGDKILAIKLR